MKSNKRIFYVMDNGMKIINTKNTNAMCILLFNIVKSIVFGRKIYF